MRGVGCTGIKDAGGTDGADDLVVVELEFGVGVELDFSTCLLLLPPYCCGSVLLDVVFAIVYIRLVCIQMMKKELLKTSQKIFISIFFHNIVYNFHYRFRFESLILN